MSSYKDISAIDIAKKLGLKPGKNSNFHCFNGKEHNHGDNNPSLSINKKGFKCHACGRLGNNMELVKQVKNMNFEDSLNWLRENFNLETNNKSDRNNKYPLQEGKKYQIRLIIRGSKRFIFLSEDKLNLRKPNEKDITNIKNVLNKSYSLETLNKANIKINHGSGKYGLVFSKGQIIYNPNNKNDFLHVEGRTDYLTALEHGLDNYYGIVSEFNKTSKIICFGKTHIFVMDSDDFEESIKRRLKHDNEIEAKFIQLPSKYNDLSDYFNNGECKKNDILKLINSTNSVKIKASNREAPGTISISTNAFDIKNYIKSKQLICVGSKFYEYKDGYYQDLHDEYIKQEIAESLGKYNSNVNTILDGLKTFAFRKTDQVNPSKYLNLRNCIFDTEKLTTITHNPELLMTVRIPVNYTVNADCPRFIKFIEEVIPTNASRLALQEYLGYSLSTQNEYHKSLFLIGTGSNGKGVLLNVINKFFGTSNISYLDLSDLGNETSRAVLFGKLINISSEMSGKISNKDFKVFKQVTSFEEITARYLYNNSFAFKPTAKFIFSTNDRPVFPENNMATFRRLLFIDFPIEFSEERGNVDLYLIDKLKDELEGIFLWLIEGLLRLRENGRFSQDNYMRDQMNIFKINNDSIGMFIRDCCIFDSKEKIKKAVLYDAYKKYCAYYDVHPVEKNKFGRVILSKPGVQDDRNEGGRYKGIGIETESNDNTDFQFSINSVLPVEPVISTSL
jgi:putative DNA primase/helicase